jgi:hypothetical protein
MDFISHFKCDIKSEGTVMQIQRCRRRDDPLEETHPQVSAPDVPRRVQVAASWGLRSRMAVETLGHASGILTLQRGLGSI